MRTSSITFFTKVQQTPKAKRKEKDKDRLSKSPSLSERKLLHHFTLQPAVRTPKKILALTWYYFHQSTQGEAVISPTGYSPQAARAGRRAEKRKKHSLSLMTTSFPYVEYCLKHEKAAYSHLQVHTSPFQLDPSQARQVILTVCTRLKPAVS